MRSSLSEIYHVTASEILAMDKDGHEAAKLTFHQPDAQPGELICITKEIFWYLVHESNVADTVTIRNDNGMQFSANDFVAFICSDKIVLYQKNADVDTFFKMKGFQKNKNPKSLSEQLVMHKKAGCASITRLL